MFRGIGTILLLMSMHASACDGLLQKLKRAVSYFDMSVHASSLSDREGPNLLLDAQRIAEIRRAVHVNPAAQYAFLKFLDRVDTFYMTVKPEPVIGKLRVPSNGKDPEGHKKVVFAMRPQFIAMHYLAIAHALTGKRKYAKRAKKMLMAWVKNTTEPVDAHPGHEKPKGDTALAVWFTWPNALYAFDLLKGSGVFSKKEKARILDWFRVFVDYHMEPNRKFDNKENWHILFLAANAHVLGDPGLMDIAIKRFKRAIDIQIHRKGFLMKEVRRGHKGTTYTLMALEPLFQFVLFAERHGYGDLKNYDVDGRNLKLATDYLLKFLLDHSIWKKHYDGDDLRLPSSRHAWGYIFELPYAWWGDSQYLQVMNDRPYQDPHEWKGYSLGPATLLFAGY